jgi:dGTPase
LRVVDQLEERYPDFDGLNLTFETREGILKHCSHVHALELDALEPGGVAHRFLVHQQPSLEAQLCNLVDEIAYNAHDVDDGVRSGLISLEQLQGIPLVDGHRREALQAHPHLGHASQQRRLLYETIRRMLSAQVYDVIAATQAAICNHQPDSVDAVRASPALVAFGAAMREQSQALKSFLMRALYRHPQVAENRVLAKTVLHELFELFCERPGEMQPHFAARSARLGTGTTENAPARKRIVADYIAGMTDRFASREHERLTGQRLLP